jgi:hypothetical protein
MGPVGCETNLTQILVPPRVYCFGTFSKRFYVFNIEDQI